MSELDVLASTTAKWKKHYAEKFEEPLNSIVRGWCDGAHEALTHPRLLCYVQSTVCAVSSTQSHKEAWRQVERIRPYLEWLHTSHNTDVDVASVNKTMGLLRAFASGPGPVPMAAVSDDGSIGLSIQSDSLYLDLTLEGQTVDYLLRSDFEEVYDEEMYSDGLLPPKLLGRLYENVARNGYNI